MNSHELISQESIDLKKYIFKIVSNWYWFALTVSIALGAAFFINRYSDPVYMVRSSILVKGNEGTSVNRDEIIDAFDMFKHGKNIPNEIGIIKSYDVTRETLEQLDVRVSYFGIGRIRNPELYRPFIEVKVDTSHYQVSYRPVYITLLENDQYRLEVEDVEGFPVVLKFGEKLENEYFSFTVDKRYPDAKSKPEYERYYFFINDLNSLTNRYRGMLGVNLTDKEGSILQLSIQSFVPQKEANYLNKLAEVYIQAGLEEKNQIATKAIEFIDDQINDILDSLDIAENNLQNFRMKNKIVNISQEGTYLYQQYEKAQTEKALLGIQQKYYNYLSNYLQSKEDFSEFVAPSVIGIDDQVLKTLLGQLNSLYVERNSLNFSSKKSNPAIELLNMKIKNLKDACLESINNLISANRITLDEIDSRINRIDINIQKLPYNERRLINIQRKFDINSDVYTYLLQKRAEAGIMRASNIPDVKILDKARPENSYPIAPKRNLNYTIALIIGLIIPFLFIVVRDYFNDKITDRKDIEANTTTPIIGVIGHSNKPGELIAIESPKSAITESFRTIKTNLMYALPDKPMQVLAVTSTKIGRASCRERV